MQAAIALTPVSFSLAFFPQFIAMIRVSCCAKRKSSCFNRVREVFVCGVPPPRNFLLAFWNTETQHTSFETKNSARTARPIPLQAILWMEVRRITKIPSPNTHARCSKHRNLESSHVFGPLHRRLLDTVPIVLCTSRCKWIAATNCQTENVTIAN